MDTMKKHSYNAPAARRPQLDGSMDPTISFMRLPDPDQGSVGGRDPL
jgi:hypothetical protein